MNCLINSRLRPYEILFALFAATAPLAAQQASESTPAPRPVAAPQAPAPLQPDATGLYTIRGYAPLVILEVVVHDAKAVRVRFVVRVTQTGRMGTADVNLP